LDHPVTLLQALQCEGWDVDIAALLEHADFILVTMQLQNGMG